VGQGWGDDRVSGFQRLWKRKQYTRVSKQYNRVSKQYNRVSTAVGEITGREQLKQ
jgi:hypothetical protein